MQKLFSLVASLVAFTSIVNADYDDAQLRNLENRVTVLEQKKGCNGMINPSARPVVDDGADLFISADFLYWRCHENGLGYVIKNGGAFSGQNPESVGAVLNSGKIKNVHPDWRAGFRVGVGYNLDHDGWDLSANWTRYYTHAHNETFAPIGGTLIPAFINPAIAPPVGTLVEAEAHWKLHLNVIDFELGREFFVSRCMTIRPFGGLKTAWLNQKMRTEYDYLTAGTVQTIEPKMSSNFWGIGLMGGLDSEWKFSEGWSIYASGDIALLYGYYKIRDREYGITSTAQTTRLKVKDDPTIGRAITDLAAGLRWEEMFSCDSFRLRIQAGWEQHMYFSQNQFIKFTDALEQGIFVSNQGDISFEGWVLNAQFDF